MKAWEKDLFKDPSYETRLYWIEDNQETWDRIKDDLKKDAWIIPVKTDCIRSYGFLQAFRDGANVTITLDDDVVPTTVNAIRGHLDWLNTSVESDTWVRTLRTPHAPPTRGLPLDRHIVINHGLWSGVPDVTAKQQKKMLEGLPEGTKLHYVPDWADEQIIPRGKYFPMSGMNLAFDTRMTRFMYFTLQGCDIRDPGIEWGIHRTGDILAGVLAKTVLDNFQFAGVHSGSPAVYHDRLSDVEENLKREANSLLLPGIIASQVAGAKSYKECAERLLHLRVASIKKDYFRHLSNAMKTWYELCKGEPGEYSRSSRPTSGRPIQKSQDATARNPGLAEGQRVS